MRFKDLPPHLQVKVLAAGGKPRAHKFGVKSNKAERTVDGVVFASKWEARAYQWLKQNIAASITLQPRFLLLPKSEMNPRAMNFLADFIVGTTRNEFFEAADVPPNVVIIDAKGMRTEAFNIKNKLFRDRYRRELFLPKSLKALAEFPWTDHGIKLKHADTSRNS